MGGPDLGRRAPTSENAVAIGPGVSGGRGRPTPPLAPAHDHVRPLDRRRRQCQGGQRAGRGTPRSPSPWTATATCSRRSKHPRRPGARPGLSWLMGVRRQGLEPRTVALRVLVRGFFDLRRFIDMASELGVLLPLLSAADLRLPLVRGPSAAQSRACGGHGRRARRGSEHAGDGRQLGRWVRFVLDDHLPRWQVAEGGAAGLARSRSPR